MTKDLAQKKGKRIGMYETLNIAAWNVRSIGNKESELVVVVARSTLLYGSETWVTTKRDMTRLEAAEMRSLRSVKGYTRLHKIRNEVIR